MDKHRDVNRKRFLRPRINIDTLGGKMAVIMVLAVLISVIVGFIAANYIVMPWLIGYGREINVPDITGMSMMDARRTLINEGLELRVVEEKYSDNIAQSTVISQNPLPNSSIKFNKTVEVVISKGTERIIVPSVRTLFIKDAVELLNENGFLVNDTVYTFSEEVANNCAINTQPPSGVITNKGGDITLYISRGVKEDYVRMPSFIAMDPDSARYKASSLKLIIAEISEQPGAYDRPAIIVQSPDSGVWIRKGDTINLTVGIPDVIPDTD